MPDLPANIYGFIFKHSLKRENSKKKSIQKLSDKLHIELNHNLKLEITVSGNLKYIFYTSRNWVCKQEFFSLLVLDYIEIAWIFRCCCFKLTKIVLVKPPSQENLNLFVYNSFLAKLI